MREKSIILPEHPPPRGTPYADEATIMRAWEDFLTGVDTHPPVRNVVVYLAHLRTRKSSGEMMRKLSDTLSHNMCHLLGTSFRKKPSTASQKPLYVA